MMNMKAEIERVVEESGLASSMKSGSLEVLATPQMVAWMEEAACLCLKLDEDITSVGTKIDVSHLSSISWTAPTLSAIFTSPLN